MTKLLVSSVLVVLLFALAPQALKAGPLCPLLDATVHGTYVVYGTGTAVGVGPAAAVGEHTYDGHGQAVATFTVNINGNIQTHTNVPSTYRINSDCSGTAFEAGAHYSFVVSPDGSKLTWLEVDPGVVFSGTEVRLNPVENFESQVRPENKRVAPANLSRSRKPSANQTVKTAAVNPQVPRSS